MQRKKKLSTKVQEGKLPGVYMMLIKGYAWVQGCRVPVMQCVVDMPVIGSNDLRYTSVVELVCN